MMSGRRLFSGLLLAGCFILGAGCAGTGGSGAPETPEGELSRIVARLFAAYEREDASALLALVGSAFVSGDSSGNGYRYADVPRALADDFEGLERIRFNVKIDPPLVQAGGNEAQVAVEWGRRAFHVEEGEERVVSERRSTIHLAREGEGGMWRIVAVYGEPIFALSNREGRIP
ncbi:MAG: hypothetical protein HY720_12310 [Planctomycetes bacterium]|nr:hypothetical protein [Planctomycetota bacterium]